MSNELYSEIDILNNVEKLSGIRFGALNIDSYTVDQFQALKRAAIYQKIEPGFTELYYQILPSFLYSYLGGLRAFLVKPLFHSYSIMPEPKDAFYYINKVIKGLKLDVAYDNVIWGAKQAVNWIIELPPVNFLIHALKLDVAVRTVFSWMNIMTPYLPLVGIGITAMAAIKDFVVGTNKNIFTFGKMIGKVGGAVLLGVGLGFMTFGGVVGVLYTGPALLVAAAAFIGVVGLIKTVDDLYQAWTFRHDPVLRNKHLMNAAKEILVTFFNVSAAVLTLFGAQAFQQVAQGLSSSDWSLFGNAATNYMKTVVLGNVLLFTGATLAVVGGIGFVVSSRKYIAEGFASIKRKLTNTKKDEPALEHKYVVAEDQQNLPIEHKVCLKENGSTVLLEQINEHKAKITKEIGNGTSTGILSKMRDTARAQKSELLGVAQLFISNGCKEEEHEILLQAERRAKQKSPLLFSVYQGSFFSRIGKTEDLVKQALALPRSEMKP